jgi:hypothetical protein
MGMLLRLREHFSFLTVPIAQKLRIYLPAAGFWAGVLKFGQT